jgi:hypothetical protein
MTHGFDDTGHSLVSVHTPGPPPAWLPPDWPCEPPLPGLGLPPGLIFVPPLLVLPPLLVEPPLLLLPPFPELEPPIPELPAVPVSD